MSDLSATSSTAESLPDEDAPGSFWLSVRKLAARVQDWFIIQPLSIRLLVVAVALLIPATGIYSASVIREQAQMAEVVKGMGGGAPQGQAAAIDTHLPIAFGSGSLVGFLDANPVQRITVVYKPLMWNVSERIVIVESAGHQYAWYPSDLETKIFTDRAVSAGWGGKLAFVPRADLDPASLTVLERLENRFQGARPQSEKEGWKAGVSGVLSATLTLGLIGFLFFQMKGQFKSLKFMEPGQVQGDLDDLVGMDDIKAEVAQIKDQYQRRAEYAEYGISKPFNVMFSGPAGTGKTKLASYLAKELNLPILFHSAANLETGYVAGGSNTLSRIVALAKRRKRCIVFLDEAQDLFMKRGGHRKFDDDTQNTLLAVLDGVRTKSEAEIIWIVASNFNSEQMQMDEAMLRRFQMKVDFRLPNREERLAIVQHYLSQRADKVEPGLDLRHLVELTEGRSPADLETIVNQAGITAVQAGGMIGTATLMGAAERVLVGNVNANTTKERERDRRIIAIHEWGHFLVDFESERRLAGGDWEVLQAQMKTIKISLKANPRNNALGFVFHKQGANLLKTKGDIEHDVRVLLGGMANEELFFGEEGTTNGAHNDITRVTRLLHHAVAEMGMYRKTRLNFGALSDNGGKSLDEETRSIMEAQSERLYGETKTLLARMKPLTEHLAGKLMDKGEMGLSEALHEIRSFEAACHEFSSRAGLASA
ncbi:MULTISPECIES: AAA family ATPase [Ramlibacter]|uniref:AAA family ATPase n=1 Tax=Ramlibacter aquaticus TaxID=2780094 RepID=A0ABR9SI94_9BURK|nr:MULTISPECIES: AAA family ATPase [Ramlibacter]MBE7942084.1 AAA family ATPase [Ramlibacter aquaticus]